MVALKRDTKVVEAKYLAPPIASTPSSSSQIERQGGSCESPVCNTRSPCIRLSRVWGRTRVPSWKTRSTVVHGEPPALGGDQKLAKQQRESFQLFCWDVFWDGRCTYSPHVHTWSTWVTSDFDPGRDPLRQDGCVIATSVTENLECRRDTPVVPPRITGVNCLFLSLREGCHSTVIRTW